MHGARSGACSNDFASDGPVVLLHATCTCMYPPPPPKLDKYIIR